MLNISQIKPQDIALKANKVNFFAIQLHYDETEMEMMIGHNQNIPGEKDIHYLPFKKSKVEMDIKKIGDLTLYKLTLECLEERNGDSLVRYVQRKDHLKQIWDYQIRIVNERMMIREKLFYYEEFGKFRKIFESPNNFIFNLKIVKNSEYMVYNEPKSNLFIQPLGQNLYFMLLFIETKRFELLGDFIVQYKAFFNDFSVFQGVELFFDNIQLYLEKKSRFTIENDFKTFLTLICIFGLLPKSEKLLLNRKERPSKLSMLVEICERHLNNINLLDKGDPILKETFLDGLAFLIVFEESKCNNSDWINLIKKQSKNEKWIEVLVLLVLERASSLEVMIQPKTFKKLQEITKKTFSLNYDHLLFAESLSDFLNISKDIIISKLGLNPVKNQQEEIEIKNNENLENKELDLPPILSEEQKKIFQVSKKSIIEALDTYLKKNNNLIYSIKLEALSNFLKEISSNPEYFINIFTSNHKIGEICSSNLEKAYLDSQKDLELVHNILVKYYNPFVLHEIDKPKYLLKIVSNYKFSDFDIKFYKLFMTDQNLDLKDYNGILTKWLNQSYSCEKLLNNLDGLCSLFENEDKHKDKDAAKKKQLLIEKIITNLKENELKENIDTVFKKVKSSEALALYKKRFSEDIILKNKKHLTSRNMNNPLIILQNMQKKYPENKLIEDLLGYCLNQIPVLNKESILVSLFKVPSKDSLLYIILTNSIFAYFNALIYQETHKICVSIIRDVASLNLELKWVFASNALDNEQKQIMLEQFGHVVQRNNCKLNNSKEKLNVGKLLENFKRIYSDWMSMVDKLRDFLNAYCIEAIDAQGYLDSLTKVRENIDEKKINDLIYPEELQVFLPFADRLNPFVNLISFQNFIKKQKEGQKIINCREEAKLALGLLGKYQTMLKELICNEKTIVKNIAQFFDGVRDIKKETRILKELISQDETLFLCDFLSFLRDHKNTKRICKGIKSCIRIFGLNCKILNVIEEGCNLSSKSQAEIFYRVNRTLNENLILVRQEHISKVLVEFDGFDELLTFTLARTNKSEIDFMKEAVNDYDESHISTQVIFDFTNFWSFVKEITAAKGTELEFFLRKVEEVSQNKIYVGLVENLKTSKINFYGIQNLYLELTHKEEAKRKQIFKIVDRSFITFVKNRKEFDVEMKCLIKGGEKENFQTFKSVDIFELRDRAHLIVYTEQKKFNNREENNYKEEELEKFKAFCSFSEIIGQILNTLNNLSFNGYPELLNLKFDNQTTIINMTFHCHTGKFESLHEFKKRLEKILDEWNQSVLNTYNYYYELTYLKGKDFWKVEKALNNPDKRECAKGVHLLNYIGKKIIKSELDVKKSPEQRLNNLGKALANLPNNINLKANHDPSHAFYIAEISEKAIIKGLLSIYLTVEKEIPFSYQLLICHGSTSWNELVAFAYRCFFNPYNKLFCMIQPERLSFSLQDRFSALIKNLNNKDPKQRFHLAFVTVDMSAHLITSLKIKNLTKILKSGELLESKILTNYLNTFTKNC